MKRASRQASAVLAVSDALAKAVRSYVGGSLPTVVPNVVDTEFFTPGISCEREKNVVVCVANLVPVKGVDVLIRALSNQRLAECGVNLRIVGSGPERALLEKLASNLGVRSRVSFLGQLDRSTVRGELRAATVLAMPSRAETFGIAAVEALACGTPVVTTNVGGLSEIIRRPYGSTVAPDDADALALAIYDVLASTTEYDRAAAWRFADSEFGKRAFLRRLDAVYRSVLESRADCNLGGSL